ncbi:MAG: CHAP domain-containing protein [Candidatus Saccharimonas sp.]
MKLTSTTPVSKGLVTKSTLVAVAVLMAISGPMAMSQLANADQYDDQINSLRSEMKQYQDQVNTLNAKAATYQEALAQITSEKDAIIAQIEISQKQYDQLQLQINDTKQKIEDNKNALGTTLADMYVDTTVSPLEMLASSKNIADYVDQQEYRSSIQDNLTKTIDQIDTLKTKLEGSQQSVKKILDQQSGQKAQLAAKESEQQSLINQTKGDEAAYQSLVNNTFAQMESAASQQRAYYAALQAQGNSGDNGVVGNFVYSGWSGNQGCSGGYPLCGPLDSSIDQWQLYNRECVSYVAWKLSSTGHKVGSFAGVGNAYQWIDWSGHRGTAYGMGAYSVSDPQPGDAAVLPLIPGFAPWGHIMYVESVSGDNVFVSQYNFYGSGEYSTMTIKKSGVVFLRFPSK